MESAQTFPSRALCGKVEKSIEAIGTFPPITNTWAVVLDNRVASNTVSVKMYVEPTENQS